MYLRIFDWLWYLKENDQALLYKLYPLKKKKKKKDKNRVSLKTDYPNRHSCFHFLRDPCFKRLSFLKARFKRQIYISLVPNLIRELNVSWVRIIW